MYPKIKQVKATDDYKLIVTFNNDVVKEYDCKIIMEDKHFNKLHDISIFKYVKVDPGGYGISWSDYIDLSEFELWTNGVEIYI